jgi:tRNA (guanine37-N1)-methyltransferase
VCHFMKIKILTLFPDMVRAIQHSVIGRAIDNNLVDIQAIDIRMYSTNKHHKCDDVPYGGGAGMLMTAQPIYDCISSIDKDRLAKRIFLTPTGVRFDDAKAKDLARYDDLILLCGHYEGVDQRVIDLCIDECISIGDYVLTGGELAALVIVDAVCRFCQGVLSQDSHQHDSFGNGLLEYPQYTRPREFMGMQVPQVLLSGNHADIHKWRQQQSVALTRLNRPDLVKLHCTNANVLIDDDV